MAQAACTLTTITLTDNQWLDIRLALADSVILNVREGFPFLAQDMRETGEIVRGLTKEVVERLKVRAAAITAE